MTTACVESLWHMYIILLCEILPFWLSKAIMQIFWMMIVFSSHGYFVIIHTFWTSDLPLVSLLLLAPYRVTLAIFNNFGKCHYQAFYDEGVHTHAVCKFCSHRIFALTKEPYGIDEYYKDFVNWIGSGKRTCGINMPSTIAGNIARMFKENGRHANIFSLLMRLEFPMVILSRIWKSQYIWSTASE